MADHEARLIWEIYASALARAANERDDYLDRACAGDSQLRARVAALLESHALDLHPADASVTSMPAAHATAIRDADAAGRRIGNYVLQRELGRGGMGVVYLAQDLRLGRTVAIKVLAPALSHSPTVRERLLNEAKLAAGLTHPGIATVYALEEIDGELYLACEYVPGAPLRALVQAGPLPIDDVVDIGLQLARALAEAHTKGIVHRDIKPENVIKTPSGVVKVLDFGLARAADAASPRLTQTGMLVGTPAYLAPEQALGQDTDFRTDIFALGLLLYELASGINPFVAKTIPATIARIVEEDPPRLTEVLPHCVPELDRIIQHCLRKDPAARYRATHEVVSDLERLRGDLANRRSAPTAPDDVPADSSRRAGSQRWLVNHQVIVSGVYLALLYPAWHARVWLPVPWNMWFLLAVLAAVAAAMSLRMHVWFVALTFRPQLARQHESTQRWTRVCDVALAGLLIASGMTISGGHPEFAMLFVGAAVAILVAAFAIEPATARAAFGEPRGKP